MKTFMERLRKNGPHKKEMDAYDSKNFQIEPKKYAAWDIQPSAPAVEDADTEPMPAGREDLEAVESATTLEEALQAYDARYSVEAANKGEQSPQFGVDMLLRIADKFADQMTPEQSHAVAKETIAMGHAIGRMANMPEGTSKDRTSLRGLVEMPRVITIAQEHAPEEIPSLEQDLRDIAEKIESRVDSVNSPAVHPLTGPIIVALDEFDKQPDKPFEEIVEELDHQRFNQSYNQLVEKLDKEERERMSANKRRESLKLAETAAQSLRFTKEPTSTVATGVYRPPNTQATGKMSLEDLEDDEEQAA